MRLYDMLGPQEKAFHNALQSVVNQYGPYDQPGSGVWVGYVSANDNDKASKGIKCSNCSFYEGQGKCTLLSYLVQEEALCRLAAIPNHLVSMLDTELGKSLGVGSMVSWGSSGGTARGKIKRIIRDGKYNVPNSSFEITGTSDDPAAVIEVYRDGKPSGVMVGHKLKTLRSAGSTTKVYGGCGCPECLAENISCEECDFCNPSMNKADGGYAPNNGMKSAARRALKWKEQGKATGAGTPVGWGRASDIVAGRSMSLDTVKRMYSFFSRHEVDKKGKDFYNTSNPSNGRIMWDAWGGDAGFSWSRAIVEREKAKKAWQGSAFSRC
jgi:hypothetical protein